MASKLCQVRHPWSEEHQNTNDYEQKEETVWILISNAMTGGTFGFAYSTANRALGKTEYKDRKRATCGRLYKTVSPALAKSAIQHKPAVDTITPRQILESK